MVKNMNKQEYGKEIPQPRRPHYLMMIKQVHHIPEEWNDEQMMIAQMCKDFIHSEINPNLDRIDNMEEGLMPSLIDKAGELGLLSLTLPEEFGGMNLDFKTSKEIFSMVLASLETTTPENGIP